MVDLPWQIDKKQFRGQGSYRFTPAQRKAYALYLDVKIVSFVHEAYQNVKSIPDYGFWGYASVFYGAVPQRKIAVEFANQRLLQLIARDTLNLAATSDAYYKLVQLIVNFAVASGSAATPTPHYVPTSLGHEETVVKFKALPLSQFEFTCYWLDFEPGFDDDVNVEPQDPTDGDPEYPYPKKNDPSDPFAGNDPSSDPDPNSDPNDYAPPGSDGEWVPKTVYFGMSVKASTAGTAPNCIQDATYPENFAWENAGPPPYTVEVNYGISSPCTGRGQGFRIVAADGTRSPGRSELATVFSADIVVFQFTPFPPV